MTNRDRLLAVLDGRPVDRVPIWLLFPYHRTSYYADVRANPLYRDVFELSRQYAVMLDRRGLGARLWAPDVVTEHHSFSQQGWQIQRRSLSHRGRALVSETRTRPGETVVRRLLQSEDELETYLTLPVDTDRARIEAQLEEKLPAYLAERAEFPLEYGAMMLDLGEPIGPLYGDADLSEYPIWSLTHGDAIVDFLHRVMEQKRIVYRYCLERDLADVYFLVGSELASPPMVSRATFQRWIVPFARELIGMVHDHGKKVIQHYHGQIAEILPDFLTMGADGLHTIEAPPVGNCTHTQAYDVVGDRIALIGNIQYDCFRSYTPEEMRAAVREVIGEVAGRRFILSPSAGPYEHTPSARTIENYLAFLRAGWEFGMKEPS